MALTRDELGAWLGRYLEAWRSYDRDAIGDLFSEDATYTHGEELRTVSGRAAIVEEWLSDRDEPGTWEAHYEPLAIDRDVHVVIGWTRYLKDGEPDDEYSNIFVCRFDEQGRCTEFREWWMRTSRVR